MSSLDTAAAVLRLMSGLHRAASVTEVAAGLALPKSTVSRLLRHMAEAGLLERDPASLLYRPGLLLLEAGRLACHDAPLCDRLEAALGDLTQLTGHTGYISVLDGSDVIVLRVSPGTQALRLVTFPGHRSPAWATSTGRALLARLDDAAVAERLATVRYELPANAPRSLADVLDRLAPIRRDRFAVALDETLEGTGSVSAAILDPGAGSGLAFCLSFPRRGAEETRAEIGRLAHLLIKKAESIGRVIGDEFWAAPAQPDLNTAG